MTLQLHRPDGKGGIEPRPVADRNWHNLLRSSRWGDALRGGKLPALRNTDMNPTPAVLSIAFWAGLGALTFILLVAGYGTGFWG